MPDVDHVALLELVADVLGPLDLPEYRHGVLRALRRAVPCDWISLNDLSGDPADVVAVVEPPFDDDAHALWAGLAHQNPLVARFARTGDGRAYRFSDVIGREELQATDLHREFYGPIGLRHQIAFTLPHPPRRILALALSRRDMDFSDAERDLLDAARPFLIDAYRTALTLAELRSRLPSPQAADAAPAALLARGLTPREADVVVRAAHGGSNRDVARALGLSPRTVEKHLERGYRKLGVGSREQAAVALAAAAHDEAADAPG